MINNNHRDRSNHFTIPIIIVLTICFSGANSAPMVKQEEILESKQDNLTLIAHWAPFVDSIYKFGEQWETLKQLQPAAKEKTYSANDLAVFLPPAKLNHGDYWRIDVEKVIPILQQFHEGATHRLHHGGPQGAYGCIAAENDSFRRIRARIHAEFDLPDGSYTPSQFAGDLIVDRSTDKIVAFKLAVPPRRNNVDLNWKQKTAKDTIWADKDGNVINTPAFTVIADIGYCEKMELIGGDWDLVSQIQWDREITLREVDKSFRTRFYKFARIDWLPWEEAVAESRKTGKPLHVVALFGPLDDESC